MSGWKGSVVLLQAFSRWSFALKAEISRSKVRWCRKNSLHSTPIYPIRAWITENSTLPKAFAHSINCSLCKNSEDKLESLTLNIFSFQLQDSVMVAFLITYYYSQIIPSFNHHSEINGSPIKKQFILYKHKLCKRSNTMFLSFVIGCGIRKSLNHDCPVFPWRESGT